MSLTKNAHTKNKKQRSEMLCAGKCVREFLSSICHIFILQISTLAENQKLPNGEVHRAANGCHTRLGFTRNVFNNVAVCGFGAMTCSMRR